MNLLQKNMLKLKAIFENQLHFNFQDLHLVNHIFKLKHNKKVFVVCSEAITGKSVGTVPYLTITCSSKFLKTISCRKVLGRQRGMYDTENCKQTREKPKH